MSTAPPEPTPVPPPEERGSRIGADWAAVIVAAVFVALALIGLLPSIPFLVK